MLVYYRLFDLLRKQKVTQRKLLADKVVASNTLQRLRANETVTSETLSALCKYLDCQIEDICEFVPSPAEKANIDRIIAGIPDYDPTPPKSVGLTRLEYPEGWAEIYDKLMRKETNVKVVAKELGVSNMTVFNLCTQYRCDLEGRPETGLPKK